jgi:hypothetical protein
VYSLPAPKELAEKGLPEIAAVATAKAKACMATAKQAPPARPLTLRSAERAGRLDLIIPQPALPGINNLAKAGLILAWSGDQAGLDACDRAVAEMATPILFNDVMILPDLQRRRDDAHLALLLRGRLDRQRRDAWLAETWRDPSGDGWRAERLLGPVRLSQALLADAPLSPVLDLDEAALGRGGVWQNRNRRAWTAGDLAILLDLYRSYEQRGQGQPPVPLRSVISGIVPNVDWWRDVVGRAKVRHGMMRFGARIFTAIPRPADAAAVERAIGKPLAIDGMPEVKLTYETRGTRGFRLTAVLPRKSTPNRPFENPPDARLALPSNELPELIIDLSAPQPTPKPAPRR